MNLAYTLGGGAAVIKKYRVASGASTSQVAGGYVSVATAGVSGVVLGVTTTVAEQVGHNLDAATGAVSPSADANALVSVVINPDAVYRLRMAGTTTAGSVLTTSTEQTGGSKTVHAFSASDPDPNSPSMDEGTLVCISGVNFGQIRKITSVGSNAATVVEGWVTANSAGDIYVVIPWTLADTAGDNVNLTSNLLEAAQNQAVGTGADFRPVEYGFDFSSAANFVRQSYLFAQMAANVLNTAT